MDFSSSSSGSGELGDALGGNDAGDMELRAFLAIEQQKAAFQAQVRSSVYCLPFYTV